MTIIPEAIDGIVIHGMKEGMVDITKILEIGMNREEQILEIEDI